jgi:hypothetical protein
MTEQQENSLAPFDPFMKVDDIYRDIHKGIVSERVLVAFQSILGLPRAIINSEFKKIVQEVLNEEYPHLRCSAARALIEGRVPGIPLPVRNVQPQWKKKLKQALCLLDIFETIIARYVEKRIEEAPPRVKNQLKTVTEVFGTDKVSGIMNVLQTADKPHSKRALQKSGV